MNLKVRDGGLTLGSVFKLVAIGWTCFGLIVVSGLFVLVLLFGVASGSMVINGETIHGHGAVLVAALPMIVLIPIIIVMQALIFGGCVTAGAALYRLRRPLAVTVETTQNSERL